MRVVYTEHDVRYLPQPNTVEVVLSDEECPHDLTRTAFMIPVFDDGTVMLAENARRGIEIAGGHIESWETLVEGAARECMEEVGVVVTEVRPIGFLRMTLHGEVPEFYSYPHPLSFQQFYAGRVLEVHDYTINDECLMPVRRALADLADHHRESVRHFVGEAIAQFA